MHDRALLDALEAMAPAPFSGTVWRVTRRGRHALQGSTAPGRWSPGNGAEVLYTSLTREGALAEIGYRMSLEPVWPSRLEHDIHSIEAHTARTLHFVNLTALTALGVDAARWPSFDYDATRAIAAAAHFLEFDGLIVPSARADCANLVAFLDHIGPDCRFDIVSAEPVNWVDWRGERRSG